MEGCSKYCSFCIVPYTRGEEVSRSFDSVLEKWATRRQGVAESHARSERQRLLGTDGDGARVDSHAHHHVARVPGIERIRFTLRTRLIQRQPDRAFATSASCRSPAPAGAERLGRVLALMKRGYTTLEFKEKVRKLRAARPTLRFPRTSSSIPARASATLRRRWRWRRDVGFDQSFSFSTAAGPARGGLAPDDTGGRQAGAPGAQAQLETQARHQLVDGRTASVCSSSGAKKKARARGRTPTTAG